MREEINVKKKEKINEVVAIVEQVVSKKGGIIYPMMLRGPFREINLSVSVKFAVPDASLWMFPRSPTCRSDAVGAP